eukprot:SM005243S17514  [mRNA]  locus=s5243:531:986:+ [translate_table: standard]
MAGTALTQLSDPGFTQALKLFITAIKLVLWRNRELELDDEDYELLQENVAGYHRPPPKAGDKKKFKRLKKRNAELDVEEEGG